MTMQEAIHLFISYAHEDGRLLKKLEAHLALLRQQGLIQTWHDHDISAGTVREHEIAMHLNTAHIILLLISAKFLASAYCYSQVMMQALDRHASGHAHVIPILLRPVDWTGAPFSHLQVLPTGARPATGRGWQNIDEAFADVAQGIRTIVENHHSPQGSTQQQFARTDHQREVLHTSHVRLIDASLDPRDSPYEQTIEQGRKTIRYIGSSLKENN